jgi:anti-sigma factor RsiW
MLNCKNVKKLLSRYIDAETDEATALELKAHFEGCPSCARELSELNALKIALVKKERKSLPEDYLIYRLRERLRSEETVSPRWLLDMGNLSRRLIPVPVAVIALSLVFLSATLREFDKVNVVDSYLFQDNLGGTELNLLEESQVSLDSATRIVFEINADQGR